MTHPYGNTRDQMAARLRDVGAGPAPYRCEGCGKTSRIAAHEPGCPVAAAWDRSQQVDVETTEPGRYLAGLTDTDERPIARDEYAEHLDGRLDGIGREYGDHPITIGTAEAHVIADLLDELAAVYRDEPLGQVARRVAVRLYDRLGI